MKNATTNNLGFTLIELIISIAIIAILLIAGASILSTTLIIIADEGVDTGFLYQAQEAMERLTSGQIANLTSYPKLQLQTTSAATMVVKDSSNISHSIVGKYYIIRERGTSRIILKSFVPN